MEKARRSRILFKSRAETDRRRRRPGRASGGPVSMIITVRPRTHTVASAPRVCVCGFLLINFKTLRIFFQGGCRGVCGGWKGVKIGDGRRPGCHRRGLLNRLVRGRTELTICTCTRVINGLRSDFKSWNNSLLQGKLSATCRRRLAATAAAAARRRPRPLQFMIDFQLANCLTVALTPARTNGLLRIGHVGKISSCTYINDE